LSTHFPRGSRAPWTQFGPLLLLIALVAGPAAIAQTTTTKKSTAKPATTSSAPAAKPAAPKPPVQHPDAQTLDAIAAMVNDEPVLASDVEEQLFLFLQRAQAQPDSSQVDTLRRQVLDQLIDEKLVLAEAKKQNITVSPAEVQKQVEAAIADAKQKYGGDDGFKEQLARENTTEAPTPPSRAATWASSAAGRWSRRSRTRRSGWRTARCRSRSAPRTAGT